MKALDRLEELLYEPFDSIITFIKNGKIIAGKRAKITKSKELKSLKELLANVTRKY